MYIIHILQLNLVVNYLQDLPNNMIHQVAIKSLPQEWLWCETWCSEEEKTKAKTIDLVKHNVIQIVCVYL